MNRRERPNASNCEHTDRPNFCLGLCQQCYGRKKYLEKKNGGTLKKWGEGRPPATCHPDKPHVANGLCSRCYAAKKRKENPEEGRIKARKWRNQNPQKAAASSRRWEQSNPERVRKIRHQQFLRRRNDPVKNRRDTNSYLQRTYGITVDDYDNILRQQGGKCGLCDRTTNLGKGRFSVDHSHTTGRPRGLLCDPCNYTVGKIESNLDRLDSIIQWIGRTI